MARTKGKKRGGILEFRGGGKKTRKYKRPAANQRPAPRGRGIRKHPTRRMNISIFRKTGKHIAQGYGTMTPRERQSVHAAYQRGYKKQNDWVKSPRGRVRTGIFLRKGNWTNFRPVMATNTNREVWTKTSNVKNLWVKAPRKWGKNLWNKVSLGYILRNMKDKTKVKFSKKPGQRAYEMEY